MMNLIVVFHVIRVKYHLLKMQITVKVVQQVIGQVIMHKKSVTSVLMAQQQFQLHQSVFTIVHVLEVHNE